MARPDDMRNLIVDALQALGVGAERALGVGCSGGPDSVALAHASLSLSAAGRIGPVLLVHIDHQLRPDSAADAQVVDRLARTAPDSGAAVIVPVTVDRGQASLERAARDARYQAFAQVMAERDLAYMLLAHTGSDQAETVLMRAIRGTGVTGLAGIPAVRDRYVRPWLSLTRADIEAYVAAHDVPTARDPSNRDPAFFRNRVRHHWLPALRAENPNIEAALCRIAESARAHRTVLDFAAEALLARARSDTGLATRALAEAPEPVTRRALALSAERAGGQPLAARHVRALYRLTRAPSAGTRGLDLPGLRAVRVYDHLHFESPIEPLGGSRDATGDRAGEPVRDPAPVARMTARVTGPDAPYHIRTWQPGDRMRPARLRGRSRKLSDLFTDAKIARADRRTAVIVVRPGDGVIVWAQHIGPAFEEPVEVVLTSPAARARNTLTEQP